jgi:hypothetical protein
MALQGRPENGVFLIATKLPNTYFDFFDKEIQENMRINFI